METTIFERNKVSTQRIDEIYQSALVDHPKFLILDNCEELLKGFIAQEIPRVDVLEEAARRPLEISREEALRIGAIRVHSGVGSYDAPVKPNNGDNDKLAGKSFLAWADRDRINHGIGLSLMIAETLSEYKIDWRLPGANEEARRLIAEYGPHIVYNGYQVETEKLEEVLVRPGFIMPMEKVKIIHVDPVKGAPVNTVDGAKKFKFPEGIVKAGQQVAVVSHAPHLARILHILNAHDYLPDDTVPYLAPLPTADDGRSEFALMEIRGMLRYIFLDHDAAEEPHEYELFTSQLAA